MPDQQAASPWVAKPKSRDYRMDAAINTDLVSRLRARSSKLTDGQDKDLMKEAARQIESDAFLKEPVADMTPRELQAMLKADLARFTPALVRKALQVALTTQDERTAVVAMQSVLDRVLGKAGELGQMGDDTNNAGGPDFDMRKLTPSERLELEAYMNKIDELIAIARGRADVAA
jgi:hypothetical protein